MPKIEKQQNAREMRRDGYSVNAIASELGVSKGSVSIWVRDIELSPGTKIKLKKAATDASYIVRNRERESRNILGVQKTTEKLHPGLKGTVGELRVAADLSEQGFPVFSELAKMSRVDLIALVGKKLVKIQVKARQSIENSVSVPSKKASGYGVYHYEMDDVDVFAVYVLDRNLILYFPAFEVLERKSSIQVRLWKKEDKKKWRYGEDYLSFTKAANRQQDWIRLSLQDTESRDILNHSIDYLDTPSTL